MERPVEEGDNPVVETEWTDKGILSTTGHEEPVGKLG